MSNDNINFLQQTFQVLFHESLDVIFLIDYNNLSIVECNIQACRVLGSTLSKFKGKGVYSLVKEKEKFKEFIEKTKNIGKAVDQFTLIPYNSKEELKYGISSSVVEVNSKKFIILLCRDIQYISEYEERQQLIYDLFQHDLLNKLHAQIGYIDFARRIILAQNKDFGTQQVLPMLEKVKDITVRTMYNIQNATILFRLDELKELTNIKIADAVEHAIRYIKGFFAQRINVEVEKLGDYFIAADEYLYRVFVNLIIRMLSYTTEQLNVEIYIEPPSEEEARVVLMFEGLVLTTEQKEDFLIKKRALERKNLDIILLQNLIERYNINSTLSDIRRGGLNVGTKVVLRMPVVELKISEDF